VEASEYEKNLKLLRSGEEGKRLLPYYRNSLKPILQHGLLVHIRNTTDERELLAASQFAKLIEDIETIMKRVVINGESAEKVIRELLKGGNAA
jgi:hypothetical protein